LILGTHKTHEYEELIKLFLPLEEFNLWTAEGEGPMDGQLDAVFRFHGDKNQVKYEIYKYLSKETGMRPPWGIITGIRPVKLTGELLQKHEMIEEVSRILLEEYLLSPEKADLVLEIALHQKRNIPKSSPRQVGIYIGIPFCPTRCAYCSFTSNQAGGDEMERYLQALLLEIKYVSNEMKACGWTAESIYIGGGTPTTLQIGQLQRLYEAVGNSFQGPELKEFTLEAGRPDTISKEKMEQARQAGVTRVSINPQSMKQETLALIGRNHEVSQVYEAFDIAASAGVQNINADLIAGLPDETLQDFAASLDEVMKLNPQNIMVHSLAMKRASRLTEINRNFHFQQADTVAEMLGHSETTLRNAGFLPYYLYRQKQMAGSLENVGYCKPGTENIYNIRIMEENQTIVALGAGGISKAYFPSENRLERVANVSNYEIYIERLDEMIMRKEKDLFRRFETC
jgi:oxygen-independent coproporphyrinogen-3 oxidase